MAEELGLDVKNIKAGLKTNKKEVQEAVEAAYKFMNKKRSKR